VPVGLLPSIIPLSTAGLPGLKLLLDGLALISPKDGLSA
jgi:hypothetical protein